MATLEIKLDATLIVSMIRALDAVTDRDDIHEFLYDHGHYLCDIAGDVGAIRALENVAMDRDLTDAEFAALNKCRQSNNPWLHRKAGIILQDIADTANDRAACDASSVDDRPGQDSGEALETIGAIRTVWWEGGVFSTTGKRTGVLEGVETEGRICSVYTIVDAEGQRWMGNNIKFPEATP